MHLRFKPKFVDIQKFEDLFGFKKSVFELSSNNFEYSSLQHWFSRARSVLIRRIISQAIKIVTNPIGALFGRSPIRPLQGHMGKVQSCVVTLQKLVEACVAADWQSADTLAQEISSSKQDADEIKRDIRMHLPRSVFLPVARTDLLELVSIQDQIGYNCKQVAQLLLPIDRAWMKQGMCHDCDQWKRCRGNSLHLFNDKTQQMTQETSVCLRLRGEDNIVRNSHIVKELHEEKTF